MSGIAGCYYRNPDNSMDPIEDTINQMLSLLAVGEKSKTVSYCSKMAIGLGISNSSNVNTACIAENSNYVLCFNGYIYNVQDIFQYAGIEYEQNKHSVAEGLIKLYELKKAKIVEYLNGLYVIVVINKESQEVLIYTDRHGYGLLYYYSDANRFIFSTEIRPILSQIKGIASVDINALCDIFNFNSVFGIRTPIREISLLPHAAICSITPESNIIKQYWDYPIDTQFTDESEYVLLKKAQDLIHSAVIGALDKAADHTGIMLSGGLDSRLLAAIGQGIDTNLRSFSFKFKELNRNESIYAKMIADELGIQFEYIDFTDNRSILEQAEDTLLDCEGNWAFYEFIPYIKLIAKEYQGIFLINGFLLDTLFKSGWAFFPTQERKFVSTELFANRYTAIPAYIQKMMLVPELFELIRSRKYKTIEEINMNLPMDNPAELSIRFYCLNRGRRSHNMILKAFNRYVNIVLPGIDYRLVDFAFKLPYELRSNPKFYLKLISSWFPNVAKVPWDKTRKPLTNGFSKRSSKIQNDILKLKYYAQRLTYGKIDFLNSKSSFNRLLRQNQKFLNEIKSILLDPKSLSRGYYTEDNINSLIKDQMAGKDLAVAFKTLVSVEVLHRVMFD